MVAWAGDELQRASDPMTPGDELRRLAWGGDVMVRGEVARNPSTPFETLVSLAARHARDVLANPAFVRRLEEPGALRRLGRLEQTALAGSKELPARLAWALAEEARSEVRAALAANPGCPAALLGRLCCDGDAQVRVAAGRNPSSPEEVIGWLERLGSHRSLAARGVPRLFVEHEELERAERAGGWAAHLASLYPRTPEALIDELLEAGDEEALVELASQGSEQVCERLARAPGLPFAVALRVALRLGFQGLGGPLPPLMERLRAVSPSRAAARSPQDERADEQLLCERLAAGAELPPEALPALSQHSSKAVRMLLASNPHAPASTLAALANDGYQGVRLAVATNPSTPAQVRAYLRGDRAASVRQAAGLAPGRERDPTTPPAELAELASARSAAVRAGVASNANAPAEALLSLAAAHPAEVASNPALQLHLLERPDALVPASDGALRALARLPGAPDWLAGALLTAARALRPTWRERVAQEIEQSLARRGARR